MNGRVSMWDCSNGNQVTKGVQTACFLLQHTVRIGPVEPSNRAWEFERSGSLGYDESAMNAIDGSRHQCIQSIPVRRPK